MTDLTEQMIADFTPYLKDPEDFRKRVYDRVKYYGRGVQKIMAVPYRDGRPGIAEKRYYLYPEEGEDSHEWVLYAAMAGVESL